MRQHTQLVNLIRGMLAKFGLVLPGGLERALELARQIHAKEAVPDVPVTAQEVLSLLGGQVLDTQARVQTIDETPSIIGDNCHERADGRRLQPPHSCHGSSKLRIFGEELHG